MEIQDAPKSTGGRHGPWIAAAVGLAVLALLGWGVMSLLGGKSEKPRKPPTLTLLPDKPPPPPPPPKEEKKPEPKDDPKQNRPEAPKEPTPQAQNEPLKMEGAAGDGGSPFAAGSVGRDYLGGGVGGMMQGAYAARLQRHLQEELNRQRKLRETDYRVTLRVWLRRDGSVEKAELAQSTGNATVDQLLRDTLMQAAAMREAPPDNLPMPVRIRVTARGAV